MTFGETLVDIRGNFSRVMTFPETNMTFRETFRTFRETFRTFRETLVDFPGNFSRLSGKP